MEPFGDVTGRATGTADATPAGRAVAGGEAWSAVGGTGEPTAVAAGGPVGGAGGGIGSATVVPVPGGWAAGCGVATGCGAGAAAGGALPPDKNDLARVGDLLVDAAAGGVDGVAAGELVGGSLAPGGKSEELVSATGGGSLPSVPLLVPLSVPLSVPLPIGTPF